MSVISNTEGTLLLTALGDYSTGVELLRDEGIERLTCVGLEETHSPVLESWAHHGGDLESIHFVSVGSQLRGGSVLAESSSSSPSLVYGVSFEELAQLPPVTEMIGSTQANLTEGVIISDIPTLLTHMGVGQTARVVDHLLDEYADTSDIVVLSLLEDTPGGVIAGLSHRVDRVLEPVPTGSSLMLQPKGFIGGITESEVLDVLKPPRRRELLRELDRHQDAVNTESLAASVAERPIDRGYAGNPDRLLTVFRQVDLPKLVDLDLVAVDQEERVSLRPGALQVWPFLDLITRMRSV